MDRTAAADAAGEDGAAGPPVEELQPIAVKVTVSAEPAATTFHIAPSTFTRPVKSARFCRARAVKEPMVAARPRHPYNRMVRAFKYVVGAATVAPIVIALRL